MRTGSRKGYFLYPHINNCINDIILENEPVFSLRFMISKHSLKFILAFMSILAVSLSLLLLVK